MNRMTPLLRIWLCPCGRYGHLSVPGHRPVCICDGRTMNTGRTLRMKPGTQIHPDSNGIFTTQWDIVRRAYAIVADYEHPPKRPMRRQHTDVLPYAMVHFRRKDILRMLRF